MSQISRFKEATSVQFFVKLLALVSFSVSFSILEVAQAQDAAGSSSITAAELAQEQAKKDLVTGGQDIGTALTCDRLVSRCSEARKGLRDACKDAALGRNCVESARKCAEASSEQSFDTVGALLSAAGLQGNAAMGTQSGTCAHLSGKDYFDKKKELEKDLEDAQNDLADLAEDKAKLQEDFSKELQDIQQAVNDAQEELEKQKLEINDRKRERIASFQENQNRNKETMRKKNTDLLDLKGKMINANRDFAMKLVALTDASGKRACMREVQKARKDYQNVSTSRTANHIAVASAKKADLLAIYNDCMKVFDQQRVALNESKKQQMDMLNKQMADTQSELDELTGMMELASNQLTEMEADAQKEQSQAEEKVMKLMQLSQQKMVAAQEALSKKIAALTAKESVLQQKINRTNNSLMTLGPMPSSPSSTRAPAEVAEEVEDYANEMVEIDTQLRACPTSLSCGGSPSAKRSRGSSRGTR